MHFISLTSTDYEFPCSFYQINKIKYGIIHFNLSFLCISAPKSQWRFFDELGDFAAKRLSSR